METSKIKLTDRGERVYKILELIKNLDDQDKKLFARCLEAANKKDMNRLIKLLTME